MTDRYRPAEAFLEHMLDGNKVSYLEALLLFGVRSPTREFTKIKQKGFLIKSQQVPMAKVIRRINEYAVCKVPENLPYREIEMREYWISK